MVDERKETEQLLAELAELRTQLARLQSSVAAGVESQQRLGSRLRLRRVISEISSKFVGDPPTDSTINDALGALGRARGASRVYLFQFSDDLSQMDNTHEWCADGVTPQKENLKGLPADMFPWWMAKLRQGEAIQIADVSALPLEAQAEREILEEQDIQSLLVLPLWVSGRLGGFVGFDNVMETGEWSDDDVALLRLFSEILSRALEHKGVADALRESEERFRTVVEDMPALICRFLPNGVLTFVNSYYCEYFGKAPDELVGHDFFQFIPEENQQEVRAHFLGLNQDKPSVTYEHRVMAPDGTVRWQQWTDRALIGEGGRVLEYQSIGWDITETKLHQEELQASEQRYRQLAEEYAELLEQAREDAARRATLLHEVNHRVKNNLTSIIGLLRAEERARIDSESPEVRSVLRGLSRRIRGLAAVHQMLSATEWSPPKLSDLAREVAQAALQALPSDKLVALEVGDSAVRVSADQAGSLALVINELATNTIKHGLGERGSAMIDIRIAGADGEVRLEVRDDGPGYPAEALALDRRGVGLYLVDNIVHNSLRGAVRLSNDGGAVTEIVFERAS